MPEIAKCPICGQEPNLKHWDHDSDPSIYHCGAMFESIAEWNRYAVAMEFVNWVSQQHYANGLSKAMIIQKASEVFK